MQKKFLSMRNKLKFSVLFRLNFTPNRPLVAGLSPGKPDKTQSRDSPCGIYGGQSGTGTSFSPSTSVSPVSIIYPLFNNHFYLNTTLIRWTSRRNVETIGLTSEC